MRRISAAALASAAGITVLAGASTQGAGTQAAAPSRPAAYAKCAACHNVVKGGPSGIGPNLNGVLGRKAGAVPRYAYSPALAKSGVTWNRQTLNRYLVDPAAVAPGGKMPKVPLSDQERAAVIAYLAVLK